MGKNIDSGVRPWGGIGLLMVVLTIAVGIIYVIYQWNYQSERQEEIFVGLLMANTYAIYRFTYLLRRHLANSAVFYANALVDAPVEFSEKRFIREIFNPGKAVLSGLVFGSIFLLVTLDLRPWGEINNHLNIFLGLFLMVANVLTGMGLYGLFVYFRYSMLIGSNLEVDLWDRSSPAIIALVDTNRYVILTVAFIASVAMISILFSRFTLDFFTITFSIFSALMIILAYVIPLIPITAQIRRKKKQCVNKICRLIENEHALLVESGKDPKSGLDIRRFESLTLMHKSAKSVRAFPPVGQETISTAVSITLLTMFPSLINLLLDMIF